MNLRDVGEFGLLRELGLLRTPPAALPEGGLGPGDDTAVVPTAGGSVLFTADALVEDVHFRRATCPARDVGYKALAVNASDVAAMGGTPTAFTVTVSAPGDLPVAWIRDLYEGIGEAAEAFGAVLAGGDLTAGPAVVLSVALLGRPPARGPVLRSGARPGDDLFVSGCLGESALGLRLLESGPGAPRDAGARRALRRHLRPEPRLALARRIGDEGLAHAMIDVSDGLLQDLGHLLAASGAGAELWLERVPVCCGPGAAGRPAPEARRLALAGGEDYELLFASPPGARRALFRAAADTGTPVRRIGRVTAGAGLAVTDRGEPVAPARLEGYRHFAPGGDPCR